MADDILKGALEAFKISEETEAENRADALEDIRFSRLGEQWPEAVKRQRELDGRPCLTINKLAPVIRQVVNDARQNRPSMKVHPADSRADPETAEVISGMLRNIEQSSDADVAYDTGIEHAITGGFGYWRVNLDFALGAISESDIGSLGASAFEQDICIRRVANPFTVYGDPYSQAADSSDWMTAFVTETMTTEQFKAKYKGAQVSDFTLKEWTAMSAPWKNGDSVQVAEYWQRSETEKLAVAVDLGVDEDGNPSEIVVMMLDDFEKQKDLISAVGGAVVGRPRPVKCFAVKQHIMSGAEVLETNDWAGSYIPIIPVYGDEVNVEGKRFFRSLIRDAKDAQRMFNYWRTTSTELVALAPRAPFIGRKGAFHTDAAKWATANTHSHAYIEFDGAEAPQRQPFSGVPAGAIQEALNSADDIKAITGIYDASLGARSNETSGKAIMARQREGDISTFHFIDNLTRAIRHTGRVMIDLIPKVYSTERIIRILGEDGKPEAVRINSEKPQDGMDDQKEALRIHDVRTGRYDLTVSSGPSFTSRREEAATQMIELIRSYPDAAPIIGDLLAKNLDWPGADEIAKRLEKMLPPQARDEEGGIDPETQAQIEQMSQALQEMGQRLQEAEGKKDIEAQKLAIESYKAETERMTALQPAMTPDVIQAIVLQTVQQLMTPNGLPEAEGGATEMDLAA